jgi:Ser/Thr protein kinase RdoA (MazF antagonist)
MVADWLVSQGFPSIEPLIDHAIDIGDVTVTFWAYYPQDQRGEPPARELGALLRKLHALPAPPFDLPAYRPLAGLMRALNIPGTLSVGDRAWLKTQTQTLTEQYRQLHSHLGIGLVHGDAHTGNTLWGPNSVLLGDLDEVSMAPRELDLANMYQDVRYGTPESELDEFTDAYGWDVRNWEGFTVLRDMRDLHTLTGFIRRAVTEPAAADELRMRIDVLRNPHDTRLWHAAT